MIGLFRKLVTAYAVYPSLSRGFNSCNLLGHRSSRLIMGNCCRSLSSSSALKASSDPIDKTGGRDVLQQNTDQDSSLKATFKTSNLTPTKEKPKKKSIIIIGAGFGGLTACQQLSPLADEGLADILIIDKKSTFSVGASWQYVITDRRDLASTSRDLNTAKMSGLIRQFFGYEVTNIDLETKSVSFKGPSDESYQMVYDYLILSPGTASNSAKVPGLSEYCSDMCTYAGQNDFFQKLRACKGGETICVMTATNPYKCPPALFEFAFLADEVLTSVGVRENCRIIVTNPAHPFPFGSPVVHKVFLDACADKKIEFIPGIRPTAVYKDSISYVTSEGPDIGKTLELKYDLLLGTWPQLPPEVFRPFFNEAGFISADLHTMETQFDGVFAIGDANWMLLKTSPPKPHPKAGEFAIAAAESASVMVDQLVRGYPIEEARAKVVPGRNRKCYAESGKGTGISINFILGAEGIPSFIMESPAPEVYEKKIEWLDNVYAKFFGH